MSRKQSCWSGKKSLRKESRFKKCTTQERKHANTKQGKLKSNGKATQTEKYSQGKIVSFGTYWRAVDGVLSVQIGERGSPAAGVTGRTDVAVLNDAT